jgi:anti-sigma factor RsiW
MTRVRLQRTRRGRGRARTPEPACESIRSAISARVDGERLGTTPKAIDTHLGVCPECRRFEAGVLTLDHQIGLQATRPAPDALKELLVTELERVVGPARRRWRTRTRQIRSTADWRRVGQWAGGLTPVALLAVFVPLGALSSPHAIPSHAPTPCTVNLKLHRGLPVGFAPHR